MIKELQLAHALHDQGDLALALEALAQALKVEPTMTNWIMLTQWLEEADVLDAATMAFAAVDEHGDQGPMSHRLDKAAPQIEQPNAAASDASSQSNAHKPRYNETKTSWRTRIRSHSVLMRRSHSYSKHQCGFWCLWVQKWLGRCSRRCTECGFHATSSGRCHSNHTRGTHTQGSSSNEDVDRSSAENRRPFSLFESEDSMAILEATKHDSEQDEQIQISSKTTMGSAQARR